MTRILGTAARDAGAPPGGSPTRTRFGPVDELSCYYDRPGEPNNVHLEAALPGHLDQRAFREAVAATLAAQPRARARRAGGGWWRRGFDWEYPPAPDVDPVVCTTWSDQEELAGQRASFLASAPPLDSSPPLRLLLAAGPGADCVILNAHHAALDGISCLQLLFLVAHHYSGAPQGGPGGPPREPASSPAGGAQLSGGAPPAPASPPAPATKGHLFPTATARIAADHGGAAARRDETGYGFQMMTWPRIPSLPRVPGAPAVTVNDVLIAAMVVTIGRWNQLHGGDDHPIRITMPLGGRAAHAGDPGNELTLGNLSRLAAITAQPPPTGAGPDGWGGQLVADVARQTRNAKDHPGAQVDPLSRALVAAWCPACVKRGVLRAIMATLGPLACDTSLISNLGSLADPPRFGRAAPDQMWFSTAAHMPRGLSLGVVTTGGRLHLCFRYRRALFDEAAAARFADIYAAVLSALTSAGPER
jgi:NRPS condensation-like uncharacterized protein